MTNEKVIRAFLKGNTGQATSLSSNGVKLWSYQTVVARLVVPKLIYITTHKYSPTTTAQVNMLIRIAKTNDINITWVDHEFLNPNKSSSISRVPSSMSRTPRKGVE